MSTPEATIHPSDRVCIESILKGEYAHLNHLLNASQDANKKDAFISLMQEHSKIALNAIYGLYLQEPEYSNAICFLKIVEHYKLMTSENSTDPTPSYPEFIDSLTHKLEKEKNKANAHALFALHWNQLLLGNELSDTVINSIKSYCMNALRERLALCSDPIYITLNTQPNHPIVKLLETQSQIRFKGQQWLIHRLECMGYRDIGDGICFGVSYLALQAFLAQDERAFNERLKYIASKDPSYFDASKHKKNMKLDQMWVDIQAMFDTITLIQTPETNPQYFAAGEFLLQKKMPGTPLVSSSGYINKQSNTSACCVHEMSGAYDVIELTTYLEQIASHMKHRTSLFISSYEHQICLNFEPQTQRWLLVDANCLPGITFRDCKEVSKALIDCFNDNIAYSSHTIIHTKFYTESSDVEGVKENIKQLCQSDEWIKIHEININKVKRKTSDQTDLLLIAADNNDLSTVAELVKYKECDINQHYSIGDDHGLSALFSAVSNGHVQMVDLLLRQKNIIIDPINEDYCSPFYVACQNGHTEIAQMLLQAGASIHRTETTGHTPLLVACLSPYTQNKPELFELLLGAGADYSHKNDEQHDALTLAQKSGNRTAKIAIETHISKNKKPPSPANNPFFSPIKPPLPTTGSTPLKKIRTESIIKSAL